MRERPQLQDKSDLRAEMRAERRTHVAAIPESMRGLLFLRPPTPLLALVPDKAVVGFYHSTAAEAPASAYARWFYEAGHRVALPWFAARGQAMRFRLWDNPFSEDALVSDPYGALQPPAQAEEAQPHVVFVPLLAFSADGHRLGQGGGHYDRWLAEHPDVVAIGLGWDCQLAASLPVEPHDRRLDAVVTPTRLYGPFR